MASKCTIAKANHDRMGKADRMQNQRTRPSTISPRRLIEMGRLPSAPALNPARSLERATSLSVFLASIISTDIQRSIKKPKTHRYPSLKGTDPKFRRNHRHALHGTMKALKEVKEGKRDAA